MLLSRLVAVKLLVSLMILGAGVVSGQEYPNKPVRIITSAAGGLNDILGRLIAQGISGPLGQPVIVENRPSGVIPGETVAKAPADGYTTLFTGGSLWTGPLLEKTPYDPVKDFAAITLVSNAPSLLLVHPSVPVKSVKELIALAKAKPGALNNGSVGTGATSHLSAELFKSMAGVNIVRIPYSTNASLFADMVSGQVQLTFGLASLFMQYVKAGKLKALAVSSTNPSPLFPGLPTIAAAVPGYETGTVQAMFAPANTPSTAINRLNQEIVRVLNRADVKQQLLSMGLEAIPSSPEKLATTMNAEIARMSKVIKDAGITAK